MFVHTIKKEVGDGMKLLWKKIDPSHLRPGDHIYSHKNGGAYSHHGIYIGDNYVIHFNRTEANTGSSILSVSKAETFGIPPCPVCGYEENTHRGVTRTCLDCFRRGKEKLHSIRYFVYGAPEVVHLLKKPGTCTRLQSTKTSQEVVKKAKEL